MSAEATASNEPAAAPQIEEESTAVFEPVIKLSEADKVNVQTGEEAEAEVFKLRAKLFRFDKESNEWKERGTGDLKLLEHKETKKIRLIMRRDKTHKICANHYVSSDMNLLPNVGSDRSWVWNVTADVSDGTPSAETLAIRFANSENANKFKAKFDEAKEQNSKAAPAPSAESKSEGKQKATEEAQPAAGDTPAYEAAAPAAETKPQSELTPAELKAQEAAKEAEEAKKAEGANTEAPPPAYE